MTCGVVLANQMLQLLLNGGFCYPGESYGWKRLRAGDTLYSSSVPIQSLSLLQSILHVFVCWFMKGLHGGQSDISQALEVNKDDPVVRT